MCSLASFQETTEELVSIAGEQGTAKTTADADADAASLRGNSNVMSGASENKCSSSGVGNHSNGRSGTGNSRVGGGRQRAVVEAVPVLEAMPKWRVLLVRRGGGKGGRERARDCEDASGSRTEKGEQWEG